MSPYVLSPMSPVYTGTFTHFHHKHLTAAGVSKTELGHGRTDKAFQALNLGRIHRVFAFERFFRALHGLFDCGFIDFFFGDGALGENGNFVGHNLGESSAHGEQLRRVAFGYAQLAVAHLREQRNMAGQDADLTLDGRDDDTVRSCPGIKPAPRA